MSVELNGRTRQGLPPATVHERLTVAPQAPEQALTVSVVIPTLNEAANIGWVLDRMPEDVEVVIVDGKSTDGTVETVLRHRKDAVVVDQEPAGKGAAMRAGFEASSGDVLIAMDADGSMHPQEIQGFVALFQQGFDVVKGSRAALGGGSDDLTRLRRAGNRGLVALYNRLFSVRMSDLCYGYIGFRRSALDSLGLYADGFEIESQIISHAHLAGLRVAELPSWETDRLTGESNLRTFRDGHRVLRQILRSRLTPGREHWRAMGAAAQRQENTPKVIAGAPRHEKPRSETA